MMRAAEVRLWSRRPKRTYSTGPRHMSLYRPQRELLALQTMRAHAQDIASKYHHDRHREAEDTISLFHHLPANPSHNIHKCCDLRRRDSKRLNDMRAEFDKENNDIVLLILKCACLPYISPRHCFGVYVCELSLRKDEVLVLIVEAHAVGHATASEYLGDHGPFKGSVDQVSLPWRGPRPS
jgi:hypothetical protein